MILNHKQPSTLSVPRECGYAIHWKSTVNGGIGTGTKLFGKEEAERLATDLNERYPDIDHEAVIRVPPAAEAAAAEPV